MTTDISATLAAMDTDRRQIVLLFAQALAQTTAPDLLARGRRVALNFAEAAADGRGTRHLRPDSVRYAFQGACQKMCTLVGSCAGSSQNTSPA